MAPEHLPHYIAAADGSDYLFVLMTFFTLAVILLIGVLYLTLHAMPEHMAHESNHSQMQVVGILALLALFTHNNLFWVAAVLIAAFRMPDFMTPLTDIASSLSAIARQNKDTPPLVADALPDPNTSDDIPADATARNGEG